MRLGKYHRGNVLSVVLFYGVRIETTRGRNFDTKYNVYDSEPEPKAPEEGGTGNHPITKAGQPVMVLVVGICAGALIAMVLIVIIVFKFRTRVENNYKVEAISGSFFSKSSAYLYQCSV